MEKSQPHSSPKQRTPSKTLKPIISDIKLHKPQGSILPHLFTFSSRAAPDQPQTHPTVAPGDSHTSCSSARGHANPYSCSPMSWPRFADTGSAWRESSCLPDWCSATPSGYGGTDRRICSTCNFGRSSAAAGADFAGRSLPPSETTSVSSSRSPGTKRPVWFRGFCVYGGQWHVEHLPVIGQKLNAICWKRAVCHFKIDGKVVVNPSAGDAKGGKVNFKNTKPLIETY